MTDTQGVKGSTKVSIVSDSLFLIDDSSQSAFQDTLLYKQLSEFIDESITCELNSIELVCGNIYARLQEYFASITTEPYFQQLFIEGFNKQFTKYSSGVIGTEDEAINLSQADPYADGCAYTFLNLSGKKEGIFEQVGYIVDSTDLELFNVEILKNNPVSEEHFIARSELIFNNLKFHPDTSKTLKTVKSGTFKDHTFQMVQALQSLKYAQDHLSVTESDNDRDRTKISEWSSQYGENTLPCTGQGRNKPRFSFILDSTQGEISVICESHLKLNFNNRGEKIEERDEQGAKYNRLYFGIHMHNGMKRLLVAHIGEHL